MGSIVNDAQIWDLHIHTTLGTPTKANYDNDPPEIFVDNVLKIFEKSPNKIGMISFTDHNQINVPVYQYFREMSSISIIPGIELDIFLREDDEKSKHLIFYFEENELDRLDNLNTLIQEYRMANKKVIFDEFILYLLTNDKRFVISPHAFKQGNRAINYEWAEDFSAKKGVKKFIGSFFVFWEASGQSEICKAIEFLNEYYQGENHKVIAFSDSSNYENIEKFISNPNQYFLCLNTFKGLLLAGSDNDRIVYEKDERPNHNPSGIIKSLVVNNDINVETNKKSNIEIEFSDRLNVIIGGRGQGKSALLDALAYGINEKFIKPKRSTFIKKFKPEIKNYRGNKLTIDTKVIYFSQSQINELFDGKSQDNLTNFFKEEFGHFADINLNIADIITDYSINNSSRNLELGNDCSIADDLVNIKKIEKVYKQICVKGGKVCKINYHIDGMGYNNAILKILPSQEQIWDTELKSKFDIFIHTLLMNISNYNLEQVYDKRYSQLIKKKIEMLNKKKSVKENKKVDSILNLRNKLYYIYNQELEKIFILNNIYSISETGTKIKMKYESYNGENDNKFYFIVGVNKEHPVEYARRLIIEGLNATKIKNPELKNNYELFKLFAVDDNFTSFLKESYTLESITSSMKQFLNIKHSRFERIIYKCDDSYYNLHDVSPGTQTNAIMEYLLHSESSIPLIIDQPEDNIDNEARFSKLTKWIRKQKYNRQIILVTHDANIVINGDAECVIIASYDGSKFNYKYGALEYDDILDKAAVILDGGKYAVQRRITKYGE